MSEEKGPEPDWFSHPQFATELEARVVDESGEEPRIHGFGVRSDLARHFSVADLLLLSLTGEEPAERDSEAARRAMIALSPLRTGSAPTHLGILAHLVSRDYAASLASAAAALAERAALQVRQCGGLLDALRQGQEPAAQALAEHGAAEARERPEGLFTGCSALAERPWFADLKLSTAALLVLSECGLREAWQLESALFWAWCPCVMGEVGPRGKDALESYPINLPKFRYVATK